MNRLPFVLAVAFLAACNNGYSTSPPDPYAEFAGSYHLVAFNNAALPVTEVQYATERVEITGGTMILRADHSYTETRSYRTVFDSGATPVANDIVENGTYTIFQNQITWTLPPSEEEPAFSYSGEISGNVLSFTFGGEGYQYQR